GSGPADRLQFAQFLSAELQGIPLPWEGHASLKHNLGKMYIYLENDNLGPAGTARTFRCLCRGPVAPVGSWSSDTNSGRLSRSACRIGQTAAGQPAEHPGGHRLHRTPALPT